MTKYQCTSCGITVEGAASSCYVCGSPREPIRVALIAPARRIRFWQGKNSVLGRKTLRGIVGYKDVDHYQARIFKDASGWVITSLARPTHPTRLNGSVIESGTRYPLNEGDVIEIGRLRVTVAFEYDEV